MNSILQLMIRRDGSVGVLTSILLPLMLAATGATVDITSHMNARTDAQAALDATVLQMISRLPEAEDDKSEADLRTRAAQIISSNFNTRRSTVAVTEADFTNGLLKIEADVATDYTFGAFFGFDKTVSQLRAGASKTSATQTISDHDVMLVVDNTYSLRYTDLNRLRDAAKGLVTFLGDKADTSGADVRIGMVPFARYVNVGIDHAEADWIDFEGARNTDGSEWKGCVHAYYDDRDQDIALGDALEAGYNFDAGSGGDVAKCIISPITPLTNDTSVLDEAADTMARNSGGSTYIPNGLIWGRRMLEADNLVAPHDENLGATKTVVLFSDGSNKLYWVRDDAESDIATETICTTMKDENIRIIVVAFKLNSGTEDDIRAMQVLRNCASSESDLIEIDDSDLLKVAFEDVGKKIVSGKKSGGAILVY